MIKLIDFIILGHKIKYLAFMRNSKNLIIALSFSLFTFSCSNNSVQENTDEKQKVVNYGTVKIGNQIWMDKNLDVSKFRNGDEIEEAQTANLWYTKGVVEKVPAWCYYENKTANGTVYGKLYNYWAVIDPRGLAPEGWHIPTNNEWGLLINVLGGEDSAAKTMISESSDWVNQDCIIAKSTSSSGLNILPTGERDECLIGSEIFNEGYNGLGKRAIFWSTTKFDERNSYGTFIGCSSTLSDLDKSKFGTSKFGVNNQFLEFPGKGLSVRCVKD